MINNKKVNPEALQRSHFEQTAASIAERGIYLLIEDTTDVNLTRPNEVRGLGWTGNEKEKGLLVHSTLAVKLEHWSSEGEPALNVIGLHDQQVWTRKHKSRKKSETQWQRFKPP